MVDIPEELTEELGRALVATCLRHGISSQVMHGELIRAACEAIERTAVSGAVDTYLASFGRKSFG